MTSNETTPTVTRGFSIRCVCCGTADGYRQLFLEDLNTIRCTECEEEFSVDDLREQVSQSTRLLKWIDSVPPLPE